MTRVLGPVVCQLRCTRVHQFSTNAYDDGDSDFVQRAAKEGVKIVIKMTYWYKAMTCQ